MVDDETVVLVIPVTVGCAVSVVADCAAVDTAEVELADA